MALRLSQLVLLLLGLALVAESSSADAYRGPTHSGGSARWDEDLFAAPGTCNGQIGECIDEEEEMMMTEIVDGRRPRILFKTNKFISYEALKKNKVPCPRPGDSYYDCRKSKTVNPYRRGCSVITYCQRIII
ncbi:PREDICTED: rapid alkalinization factor-like [Nelumbo nucifera]|uniref:Rapid alkalinization factor-like n=2 Tax=Nelumbo nucifera TaxID=4432 RepID=A0A822YYB3_NELNU|nr:PREDICTED: rapid alkalinization factor-like [Nelumbo nucifera]DAD37500.1 TPA_asm: hypothetical protein HUJ06_008141 [Nelumbo nucifera]